MNFQFSFRGFNPALEIVLNAESMLYQLLHLTPGVTDTSAQLAQNGKDYTCSIEICAGEVSFIDQAVATEPLEAINSIDQKLRTQILKWQEAHKLENSELGETLSAFEKQELGSGPKVF